MSELAGQEKLTRDFTWRRFVRKNLLLHLIPNTLLNTVVPYLAFSTQDSVCLFSGEQNLARFLLPMSLLLPFMITFDMLKKINLLQHSGKISFELSEKINGYPFILKKAALNSCYTITLVGALMLALYLYLPKDHDFGITASAVCAGLLAGMYSIIFFYLAIRKI